MLWSDALLSIPAKIRNGIARLNAAIEAQVEKHVSDFGNLGIVDPLLRFTILPSKLKSKIVRPKMDGQ